MITPAKLRDYLERGIIQIAPLAFMRGRTLADAVVILDEAQNTTTQQIKMFLTRMGLNTKMIVTGDVTQIDLPASQRSGLIDALDTLRGIKGIARVDFDVRDIVRHRLVQRIVEAYDRKKTATSPTPPPLKGAARPYESPLQGVGVSLPLEGIEGLPQDARNP